MNTRCPGLRHVGVLIIGAGFSGLGAAIALQKEGYTDYLVVERGNDVGGTWRVNTYPGAACSQAPPRRSSHRPSRKP